MEERTHILAGLFDLAARGARQVAAFAFFSVLLTFAGCAGTNTGGAFLKADRGVKPSSSLYGNYLAGRFAGAMRDTREAAIFYERALKQDPDNNVMLERAFLLKVADGKVASAVDLAEQIVAHDASNRLARLVLGVEAFRVGDYAAARTHLQQSRSGPVSALIQELFTAWSYVGEGQMEQALEVLDKGVSDSVFSPFFIVNRALVNDLSGRNAQAAEDYIEALRATGGRSLRIVQNYGSFLERMGRGQEAEALYLGFLSGVPENRVISAALARVRAGKSAPQLVRNAAQGAADAIYAPASYLVQERAMDLPIVYLQMALYLDPDFDIARTLLGDLLERGRRWRDAILAYAQISPSSDLYHNAQLKIAFNLNRLNQTDDAVGVLRTLLRRNPNDIELMVALGDMLRQGDRFEDSVKYYDKAISLFDHPQAEHWPIYYSRGVSLEQMKKWDAAEKDFLKAIELSPNQPLPLNYLGYSWIDQGINKAAAMSLIEQAVDLSPNDGFIVDSLGWALFRQGRFDEAVSQLERAIQLEPADPVINEHLGDAYWRVGRRIEARFQWRHALTLGSTQGQVTQIERKIEQGL